MPWTSHWWLTLDIVQLVDIYTNAVKKMECTSPVESVSTALQVLTNPNLKFLQSLRAGASARSIHNVDFRYW